MAFTGYNNFSVPLIAERAIWMAFPHLYMDIYAFQQSKNDMCLEGCPVNESTHGSSIRRSETRLFHLLKAWPGLDPVPFLLKSSHTPFGKRTRVFESRTDSRGSR